MRVSHKRALMAVGALLIVTGEAHAGCDVTLRVTNSSPLMKYIFDTKTKVKGGTWSRWKALNLGVLPNKTELRTIKTTFGCNAKRRYRIRLDCKGPEITTREAITVYFPDTSEWATGQKIDIGDVARFCK